MVTLTFSLDYDKMHSDGITEDDMLNPMREHAAKYGISEISKGVFAMDGEDALFSILKYVSNMILHYPEYVSYLKSWLLERDGHSEDCKQEAIKIFKKEGIRFV